MIGNLLFERLVGSSRQRFWCPVIVCASDENQKSAIINQQWRQHSGDNSAVAPPVPIPNTAVKRCSPDGSTAIGRARVGRRQNKIPGGSIHRAFSFLRPTRARRGGTPQAVRDVARGAERHRWSNPRGQRVSEWEFASQ